MMVIKVVVIAFIYLVIVIGLVKVQLIRVHRQVMVHKELMLKRRRILTTLRRLALGSRSISR